MNEYNYLDIQNIDEKGILFLDNRFIEFEECRHGWSEMNNISINDSVCIASRFCEVDKCYFIFYTKEPVKVIFKMNGFIRRKKNKKKFQELQVMINRCGYTSYDMT